MSKNDAKILLSQGLRFRIGAAGKLYGSISHSSGEFYVAPEVLSILCSLASVQQAGAIKNLAKELQAEYKNILQNLPNSKECDDIIQDLLASGLLILEGHLGEKYLQQDGFGNSWIQWAMLADKARCEAYEIAIKQNVNPKSIVADVGAGAGLLSALCLHAGAKKVIAIEETDIAKKIVPLVNSAC